LSGCRQSLFADILICSDTYTPSLRLVVMNPYDEKIQAELSAWQHKMTRSPSFTDVISKRVQDKINRIIPEKVHRAITVTIEKMFKAVLFGAKYTSGKMLEAGSLVLREAYIKQQIQTYKKTASAEGAVTGAGGILMGLADFPIFIVIKIKLLFEISSLYGYDVKDYKERLYILYVFQLAFSSQQRRNEVYQILEHWQEFSGKLPEHADEFDWRSFQQEYRDYIDLAKMAQMIPVIGSAVGAIANYKLVAKLGETAMNCYRMRLLRATGLLELHS
jgi:uncharacterized protein (DUF697 family)